MLDIQIINELDMTPAMDQAIRDGLCECFPADHATFSVTRQWHGTGPAFSLVMLSGPLVAAHAGIVDRTVRAGPTPVRVAGIQNVFVRPAFRGQGLANRIMIAAMPEAGRRGFDCGLLFCIPALENIYADCRWQTLPRKRIVRIDENGLEAELPSKNIAMYHPLRRPDFPPGPIHLQGNDW